MNLVITIIITITIIIIIIHLCSNGWWSYGSPDSSRLIWIPRNIGTTWLADDDEKVGFDSVWKYCEVIDGGVDDDDDDDDDDDGDDDDDDGDNVLFDKIVTNL